MGLDILPVEADCFTPGEDYLRPPGVTKNQRRVDGKPGYALPADDAGAELVAYAVSRVNHGDIVAPASKVEGGVVAGRTRTHDYDVPQERYLRSHFHPLASAGAHLEPWLIILSDSGVRHTVRGQDTPVFATHYPSEKTPLATSIAVPATGNPA